MNKYLNEEERAILSQFDAFGKRHLSEDNIAQWVYDQGIPDEVVKEFADLFLSCSMIDGNPNPHFNLKTQIFILSGLTRQAGATLPFQSDMFDLALIQHFASADQIDMVMGEYHNTGRLPFAVAITEPNAGSDVMSMRSSVRTVDGRILLSGGKTFVNNGEYAPNILVAAIDKDDETLNDKYPPLSFWLIPRDLPGIDVVPLEKLGQSMLPFSSLRFDDVVLKPEYRLQGHSVGFRQLFHILEYGRAFTCASSYGLAQAAMDDAVEYSRARESFGVKICSFQQIGEMLTDMEVALWNMRFHLVHASQSIDDRAHDERLAVALMKRLVPAAATDVASKAMQILGGIGYTKQSRIGRIWTDCRGNQIAEGTDQIMVNIATPLILKNHNQR